jgi:hypothetical protein
MVAAGEQQDEQQQDNGEGDDPGHLDPARGAGSRAAISALVSLGGGGWVRRDVREPCAPCPTVIRTFVRLRYPACRLGKRRTRPSAGRWQPRWSGARSSWVLSLPPCTKRRPTWSPTCGWTAARSGASCTLSGTFILAPTVRAGVATSPVGGHEPPASEPERGQPGPWSRGPPPSLHQRVSGPDLLGLMAVRLSSVPSR